MNEPSVMIVARQKRIRGAAAIAAVLSALSGGCFPHSHVRTITEADILAQGDADVLRAQQALHGRRFLVSGTVTAKEIRERPLPASYRSSDAESKSYTEQRPVVVLGSQGRVKCYFENESLNDAASVTKGTEATLECSFLRFRTDEKTGVVFAELDFCSLPMR